MSIKIFHDTDSYVAFKKLKLLKSNSALSTLSTLWKGEVILCEFDNIHKEIKYVTAAQLFTPEDFANLEKVINNFFGEPS